MERVGWEKRYALALSMVKNLGCVTYKRLVDFFGSARNVFDASLRGAKGIGAGVLKRIQSEESALLIKAKKVLVEHERRGFSIVPYEDQSYPERLRLLYDPPPVLYTNFSIDLNKGKLVAIVGSREGTDYGKRFVKKLVGGLCNYDETILSGLAYGIDICAHRAALEHEIPTIGVLASGLDMIYPATHVHIVDKMNGRGGIMSEHPLGVRAERHFFPSRNRIIAGLVDAVIVVEAGGRSGALITAKYANELDRDVFALPGNVDSVYSEGCHHLIKTHQAHMITGVEDLVYIMNWDTEARDSVPGFLGDDIDFDGLDEKQQAVIKVLDKQGALDMNALHIATGLSMKQLPTILLQLEIKNLVSALPGNLYSVSTFSFGH